MVVGVYMRFTSAAISLRLHGAHVGGLGRGGKRALGRLSFVMRGGLVLHIGQADSLNRTG